MFWTCFFYIGKRYPLPPGWGGGWRKLVPKRIWAEKLVPKVQKIFTVITTQNEASERTQRAQQHGNKQLPHVNNVMYSNVVYATEIDGISFNFRLKRVANYIVRDCPPR